MNEPDFTDQLIEVSIDLDATSMSGRFTLAEHVDERRYDSVTLWLEGHLQGGVFSGELFANAEGSTGDTVSMQHIPIATSDGA